MTVYAAPKRLTEEAEKAFLTRLDTHVQRYRVERMTLVLHGGEPLLFGKHRFAHLCEAIRSLEARSATRFDLQVTTNGVLVDDDWAALLAYFRVATTLSIDGSQASHDTHRRDLLGRPTHEAVVAGLRRLRRFGVEPSILCVADVQTDPLALLGELVERQDCKLLDVLLPDATHEDDHVSVAPFFMRLFDLWYDQYADRGIRIRLFEALIRSLCGYWSGVESIGYGPTTGVTLLTDGSLEAHDVVRIARPGMTASAVNVFDHEIDEVRTDPLWAELYTASLALAQTCRSCTWRHACGGGHIASRWSEARRFDNPSAYCSDWKSILSHVWQRILPTLTFESANS